jgi:phage gp29-like protein
MSPLLKPLLERLQNAQSFDDVLRILADAAQDMNISPVEQAMFDGIFQSYAYGRATPPEQ